jgi:hypothetical protein
MNKKIALTTSVLHQAWTKKTDKSQNSTNEFYHSMHEKKSVLEREVKKTGVPGF